LDHLLDVLYRLRALRFGLVVVGAFLGNNGVFYGLALGLIAVASWQSYTDIDNRVSDEAGAMKRSFRIVHDRPDRPATAMACRLRIPVTC
jgi:hypothetical protein